jgi:hypothetical protein
MKKCIIIAAAVAVSAWGADEKLINEIDSVVSVISKPRVTVESSAVNKVDDPFVRMSGTGEKKTVATQSESAVPEYKRIRFNLEAIVNSKAKINGRWVGRNEKIRGFKLTDLGLNYAKLRYYNYTKILYINKNDNTIITKGSSDED